MSRVSECSLLRRATSTMRHVCFTFVICLALTLPLLAQSDSIDVAFYYKPSSNPSIVYLPGEFNTPVVWQLNSSTAMTKNPITGIWLKTIRLRVGGPASGGTLHGTYQYKFNENGNVWLSDPLNWRTNPADNNNSYIVMTNPLVFYLSPKYSSPPSIVKTSQPAVTGYLLRSLTTVVDTSKIRIVINGSDVPNAGSYFDVSTGKLSYTPSQPLANGTYRVQVVVGNNLGATAFDTTVFVVQTGFVQILTQPNDQVHFPTKTIEGSIEDTTIAAAILVHNDTDSTTVPITGGFFSATVTLSEGLNTYKVVATSGGQVFVSSQVQFTYIVDHTPKAKFTPAAAGASIVLMNLSTDPDGDPLTSRWASDDTANPVALHFSSTESSPSLTKPAVPGEYYFTLEAQDPAGHIGKTRNYFIVDSDGTVSIPTVNSNPQWVKDAIVYEIFVKSFSSAGTLDAVRQRLTYLKSLGVNVLWLVPIMVNRTATNESNAGYDIIDFYSVAPQFGTLDNFRALADSAHRLGIKIILDITPNHVSDQHPWVNDIRVYGAYSDYRNFIETRLLGDSRGLGQSLTYYGGEALYAHYSNWALANLNLSDSEAQLYMDEMLEWWISEQHADGYRMDVYWGPQNRYGKDVFWRPFRELIKNVKPDIFVLGETDGTGVGSENNYADGGGACDAAYDWNFYGVIKSTLAGGSVNDLDNRVTNYGYSPGVNSYFLRFLENHDEQRIAQLYSIDQTKAGAVTIFTIPGIPMIYAGQEVGWKGQRNLIDFANSDGTVLFPFYQRLARIRTQFPAFRAREIKRVSTSDGTVYAFLRPYKDQNALVVINFSGAEKSATLTISESDLNLTTSLQNSKRYYLNDVLNDTSYAATESSLASFGLNLHPWSSAVMILADSAFHLSVTTDVRKSVEEPLTFRLSQNYPNPFNPQTSITYALPKCCQVRLAVFDLLGREVATLVREHQSVGLYSVPLNGTSLASGVYFYQLSVVTDDRETFTAMKKMILLR